MDVALETKRWRALCFQPFCRSRVRRRGAAGPGPFQDPDTFVELDFFLNFYVLRTEVRFGSWKDALYCISFRKNFLCLGTSSVVLLTLVFYVPGWLLYNVLTV
jgi:hypothetical protein